MHRQTTAALLSGTTTQGGDSFTTDRPRSCRFRCRSSHGRRERRACTTERPGLDRLDNRRVSSSRRLRPARRFRRARTFPRNSARSRSPAFGSRGTASGLARPSSSRARSTAFPARRSSSRRRSSRSQGLPSAERSLVGSPVSRASCPGFQRQGTRTVLGVPRRPREPPGELPRPRPGFRLGGAEGHADRVPQLTSAARRINALAPHHRGPRGCA